jgi:hypothetical protein
MRKLAIAAVLALTFATSVVAQPASPPAGAVNIPSLQITDADSLVASCNAAQTDPQWGMRRLACAAYIAGATDSVVQVNAVGKGSKLFCPMDPSYAKVRDGVMQFVKDNPAQGKMSAGLVVALVMPKLFPCPK